MIAKMIVRIIEIVLFEFCCKFSSKSILFTPHLDENGYFYLVVSKRILIFAHPWNREFATQDLLRPTRQIFKHNTKQ